MEENKINQESEVISDEQVDKMYNKMKGKKSTREIFSKIKGRAFSGIKKIETDVQQATPLLEKMKEKTSHELSDVAEKSGTKLSSASKSINEITKKSFDKTKIELSEGKAYLKQNAPIAGAKIKDELSKGAKSVKENAPKFGKQTKASFIDSIERIYGASTRGKQYGEKSVEILQKIAELKQSGLITEEEYLIKKKELLGRI